MELTPKTRKETFLAAAGGQDITTPTPVTREEVFLDAIAKGGGGGGSSGGGVLVVNATKSGNEIVCDRTAGEMLSAYKSGTIVIIKAASESMVTYENVMWVDEYDKVETSFHTLVNVYDALTMDDYPSYPAAD